MQKRGVDGVFGGRGGRGGKGIYEGFCFVKRLWDMYAGFFGIVMLSLCREGHLTVWKHIHCSCDPALVESRYCYYSAAAFCDGSPRSEGYATFKGNDSQGHYDCSLFFIKNTPSPAYVDPKTRAGPLHTPTCPNGSCKSMRVLFSTTGIVQDSSLASQLVPVGLASTTPSKQPRLLHRDR